MPTNETQVYIALVTVVISNFLLTGVYTLILLRYHRRKVKNYLRLVRKELRTADGERTRLAMEWHDETGAALVGIRFKMAALPVQAGQERKKEEILSDMMDLGDRIRRVTGQLHPMVLERSGLRAAVEHLLRPWQGKEGTTLRYHWSAGRLPGDEETAAHCYRIIQELLNNITKHAEATELEVSIRNENHDLVIEVRDNGRGFNTSATGGSGFGLRSITMRADLLAAHLSIESKPGKGTTCYLRIPV